MMCAVASIVFILGAVFLFSWLWEWSPYGGECLLSQPVFCLCATAFDCCVVDVRKRGSSVEYALASTVSPKRRRGVISFLIRLQIWLLIVGRKYPCSFLVGSVA